jgi:purine-binding chemotaxis protein CheW
MLQEQSAAEIEQANDTIEAARSNNLGEQYLTFFMNKEEFGVNILSVQEIRGWEEVTPIPNAPAHVKGVMNLRGTVAPVIDLRMCFGLSNIEYTEETVVIILAVPTANDSSKTMGVVVDAVSDVHNFDEDSVQPSPELSHEGQAQYIKGLGSTDDQMVILLNLTDQLIDEIKH